MNREEKTTKGLNISQGRDCKTLSLLVAGSPRQDKLDGKTLGSAPLYAET